MIDFSHFKVIVLFITVTHLQQTTGAADSSIKKKKRVDKKKLSLFLKHCKNDDVRHVQGCIVKDPAFLKTYNKNGDLPLHVVVSAGSHQVVNLLLARKDVSPDEPSRNKTTPLYFAALLGDAIMIQKLIDAHADVNKSLPDGQIALHAAAIANHSMAVNILLKSGSKKNKQTLTTKKTPLAMASLHGATRSICLLLDAKADTNLSDHQGHKPICHALYAENQDCADLLSKSEPCFRCSAEKSAITIPIRKRSKRNPHGKQRNQNAQLCAIL